MRRRALILVIWTLGWALGFWATQHQWITDYVADLTTYHGWTQEGAMAEALEASGLWWNVAVVVFLLILSACFLLRADGLDRLAKEIKTEQDQKTTGDGFRVR